MNADPTTDTTALWASARVTDLADDRDVPEYGSAEWAALPPDAPQRYAAVYVAAEQWRRHLAEKTRLEQLADTNPEAWFREVTRAANTYSRRIARLLVQQPTHAELMAARAKHQPAREVIATEGWPPVAIPGRPGWKRHLIDGRQVDKPDNAQESESAA